MLVLKYRHNSVLICNDLLLDTELHRLSDNTRHTKFVLVHKEKTHTLRTIAAARHGQREYPALHSATMTLRFKSDDDFHHSDCLSSPPCSSMTTTVTMTVLITGIPPMKDSPPVDPGIYGKGGAGFDAEPMEK